MSLRFRRSIRIAPGIRLNVGLRGLSATLGPRGASVNIGSRGVYGNVGVPGTGVSWRERLSAPTSLTGGSGRDPNRVTMKELRELERSHERSSAQSEHEAAEFRLDQLRKILLDRCKDPYDWQAMWASKGEFGPAPFHAPAPAFSIESSRAIMASTLPIAGWVACYTVCALLAISLGDTSIRALSLLFVALAITWTASTLKRRESLAQLDFTTKTSEFQKDLAALKREYETDQQGARAKWARDEKARENIRSAIERSDLAALASVLEMELQNETLPVPLVFELELESTELARVEVSLPDLQEIPETLTSLTKRGQLSTKPMPQRNRSELFEDVCTALCLRLLFEMFRVVPSLRSVEAFGASSGIDPASGHERKFIALRVEATREAIASLDLDHVDPSTALTALGGKLSADRRGTLTPIPGITGLSAPPSPPTTNAG